MTTSASSTGSAKDRGPRLRLARKQAGRTRGVYVVALAATTSMLLVTVTATATASASPAVTSAPERVARTTISLNVEGCDGERLLLWLEDE